MNELNDFIDRNCRKQLDARIALKELYHAFRATLDKRQASLWPRWRFKADISNRYPTGTDSDRTVYVGGITMTPQRQYVRTEDGRLRLA